MIGHYRGRLCCECNVTAAVTCALHGCKGSTLNVGQGLVANVLNIGGLYLNSERQPWRKSLFFFSVTQERNFFFQILFTKKSEISKI